MMEERTTGLILRTYPLTDTSLIVHWLTPTFGRIATVAKGARRPKSPFRGKLDLFYSADFSFRRSHRSDLHTLREIRLRETHRPLRENIACLEQAAYGAALIEQTTESATPLPAFYTLLEGFLTHLVQQPIQPHTVFAFEFKLLQEQGQGPDIGGAKLTPGAKQIAERLVRLDWPGIARLKLSAEQVTELQQYLHGYLVYHLGRVPRGRPGG
jgi:DNA repair protein RecO (recombination protein O)